MDVHNSIRHRDFHFFNGLEGKWCDFLCGKTGRVFISKMAANFLPGHDKLFNDSGSEDEFEGFDLEDRGQNIVWLQFDGIDRELERRWSRTDSASVHSNTRPDRRSNASRKSITDRLFRLFFHQTDFEQMSEELKRHTDMPKLFLKKIKVLWKRSLASESGRTRRKPHGMKWWLVKSCKTVLFDCPNNTYLCIYSCELLWKLPGYTRISGLCFLDHLDHFYAYNKQISVLLIFFLHLHLFLIQPTLLHKKTKNKTNVTIKYHVEQNFSFPMVYILH